MKNLDKVMSKHGCLMMEYDDFKELVETETDGLKTVDYEFGAYINHSDKAEEEETYDNRDATDILSDYFDVNVTSWHSDTNEEHPCVYILYEPEPTDVLSIEQMKEMMSKDNFVSGVVSVSIHECINSDLEQFLDIISERLTGSSLLSNSNYELLGQDGDNLLFRVTGDASLIIEENE